MNEQTFIKQLKKINIELSVDQLSKLNKYYELLIEANKNINLTSIIEKDQVYLKHFYDSLTLYMVHDFNQELTLCDVGTGAGFPGIVLKICFPKLKVVLIDSLAKRITFLKMVIDELKLDGIEALHMRVEDYAKEHRNSFDVVTSRAVARLNILTELCLPLVKIKGFFIAMKGNAQEEVREINKNLEMLHSKIITIKEFELPVENSTRMLIKIGKEGNINNIYPRHFEKIKKNPL